MARLVWISGTAIHYDHYNSFTRFLVSVYFGSFDIPKHKTKVGLDMSITGTLEYYSPTCLVSTLKYTANVYVYFLSEILTISNSRQCR